MKNLVLEFIEKNLDFCIKEITVDKDNVIGVPYPYTVPAVGHFDSIYYWDTYFTNLGLFLSNRAKQAKYNTDNILFLVEKYGFMPNANHRLVTDRSQPPFLSLMVRDVYEYFHDTNWLNAAYKTLEKEYEFWMMERNTKIGLNRYGNSGFTQSVEHYAEVYTKRIGYIPDETVEDLAKQFLATAECGWDISPRFGERISDFAPVDLNALMYMFEENMAYFAIELKNGSEATWKEKSEVRKNLMIKYLDAGDGIMMDYDFVHHTHSEVFSAASFFPMFAGMTEPKHIKALLSKLDTLEAPYGILACEKISVEGTYQWGYPNGWPCLQYIVYRGLERYGFSAEAKRIARKYVSLVEKVFENTENLWEKYNVVEGNINVINEYNMPALMGWTAGVYLAAKKYLDD